MTADPLGTCPVCRHGVPVSRRRLVRHDVWVGGDTWPVIKLGYPETCPGSGQSVRRTSMRTWHLRSRAFDVTVQARTANEAFDHLRDAPAWAFGIIVTAYLDGGTDDDEYPIRTSALMGRWGRIADARLAIAAAVRKGLGDTSSRDIPA